MNFTSALIVLQYEAIVLLRLTPCLCGKRLRITTEARRHGGRTGAAMNFKFVISALQSMLSLCVNISETPPLW
jgi:hypothetical protein